MPRVICDLPNAGAEISGVKFHPLDDGGKISDEVSDDVAALFASIPGYVIDEDGREPPKVEDKPAPSTRAASKSSTRKAAETAPTADVKPDQSKADAPASGDGDTVF